MICEARRKASMTQKEFADALGVSRSAVAMWETGKTAPCARMLPKIADVLGCTIDELLRGKSEEGGDG